MPTGFFVERNFCFAGGSNVAGTGRVDVCSRKSNCALRLVQTLAVSGLRRPSGGGITPPSLPVVSLLPVVSCLVITLSSELQVYKT